MEELYEYNGEQYTFKELQEKYGNKVHDKITQYGFKKVNQNVYNFEGEDYSESELRKKYGQEFDAKIKEHGFELKKKDTSDSTEVPPSSDSSTEVVQEDISLDSKASEPFDPEGDGFDYETAKQHGIERDEATGRYPSRVPETGQILKGQKHKTYDKTIKGEKDSGFEIYKGDDGKYYSRQTDIPTDNFEQWKKEFYARNKEAIDKNETFKNKFTKKEELTWYEAEASVKNALPKLVEGSKLSNENELENQAKSAKVKLFKEDTYINEVLIPQIAVQHKKLFKDKEEEISKKYNLTDKNLSQENLSKAEKEYNNFINDTLNEKLGENEEFKARFGKYNTLVDEDFRSKYKNYRRQEEIPNLVKSNPIIEGLYKTVRYNFGKKLPESIGAMGNSKLITDSKNKIQHLKDRIDNGTLKEGDEIGFSLGGKYDRTTAKEKLENLNLEQKKLEMEFVNKLMNIEDVEDKMSIFKRAEVFNEDGIDLTWSELGTMVGDQLPQVVVAMATFGIGNAAQEAGDSYITNLRAIASKKYGTDNPTREQLLEIVNSNEDEVGIAVATGAVVGALERIGAGGQMKALMSNKKLVGSLLRGEFKEFLKKGSYTTLSNAKAGFGEFITEGSQTLASQFSTNYVTGEMNFDMKEVIEASFQGGIIGTLFPFAGKVGKQTLIETRAASRKIAANFDKEHSEYYFKAAERNINKKLTEGEITTEEKEAAIEDLHSIRNSSLQIPSRFSPKSKKKAIDLLVKKQGLEKEVDGKDKSLTEKEQLELANIDLKLKNIAVFENTADPKSKEEKELYNLPDRGLKLKEKAAKILTKEKQDKGKKEFQLTDKVVTAKAIELLKQQNDKTTDKTTKKNKVNEVLPEPNKEIQTEEKDSHLKQELKKIDIPQKYIDAIPNDIKLKEDFLTDRKRLAQSITGLAGNFKADKKTVSVGKFYSKLLGNRDEILFHEAVHAGTVTTYSDVLKNPDNYSEEQSKAVYDLNDIAFDYMMNTTATSKLLIPTLYGINNQFEFIAEFATNPKFREWVGKNNKDNKVTFTNYVWEKILTMLGLSKKEINVEKIKNIERLIDKTLEASIDNINKKGKEKSIIEHTDRAVTIGKNKKEYNVSVSENGAITAVDKKGEKPSSPTLKKIQLEYAKGIDFTLGETSATVRPNTSDKNYSDDKHISDNSESPTELAELIVKIENDINQDTQIDPTEKIIIDHLKGKVLRGKKAKKGEATKRDGSFINEDDASNISNAIGLTYLNSKGKGIDVLAQELSGMLNKEINVSDIVELIKKYPNGESSLNQKTKQEILNPAKEKFTNITKLPATKDFLNLAIKAPVIKEAKEVLTRNLKKEKDTKKASIEIPLSYTSDNAAIGIAPTLKETIEHVDNTEASLRKKEYGKKLIKVINETAEALNIEILTNNSAAGGWWSQDLNKPIKEASKRLIVKYETQEQLDTFTAFLGALAPEIQEGVYVAKYHHNGEDIEYGFIFDSNENAEHAISKLRDFGLLGEEDGFSYDVVTKTLYIGDFDNKNVKSIEKFLNFVASNGLINYETRQANISFPSNQEYGKILEKNRNSVQAHPRTNRDSFNSLYEQAQKRLNPNSSKLGKEQASQGYVKALLHERIPVEKRPSTDKPLKKLNQILADVSTALKATLVYGKTRRSRAAGTYNPTNGLARLKRAGNLDVGAHELGHLIDDRHDVVGKAKSLPNSKEIAKQIKWLRDRGGSNPPRGLSKEQRANYRDREGLAEFIRAFVVNPKQAKLIAPDLYTHFLKTVDAKTIKALEVFSDDVITFANADEGDQIISNVETSLLPKKTGFREWFKRQRKEDDRFSVKAFDKIQETMTNSMAIVNKAFDFALQLNMIDKVLPHDDFRILSRLFGGVNGKTTTMLTKGLTNAKLELLTDENGLVMNIDYLFEVLDSKSDATMKAEMNDVIKLLIAERTIEYVKKFGRKDGLTGAGGGLKSDYAVALGHLNNFNSLEASNPAKFERITEGARRYRAFADAGLKYATEKGRFSKRQYNQIKATNQYYVSLARTKEITPTAELLPFLTESNKIASVKEVLKKAKGGTETIKNPYLSLLENTINFVKEADRNEIMQKFVAPLYKDRDMGTGTPVDLAQIGRQVASGDNNPIKVYNNGNLEHWQFQDDIHKTLKGYGEISDSVLLDIIAKPADLIRFTVTNFPVFAARNAFRDTFARLILTRSGGSILDFAHSKEERQTFEMFGGGQAGFYLTSENEYIDAMKSSIKKMTAKGTLILDPRKLNYKNYQKVLQRGENLNRMAEYKSSLKAAKKQGMSDYDAKLYAAFQGRDLLDFAVSGTIMRKINRVLPFTNANIQGVKRAVKGLKNNTGSFIWRTAFYTVAPQLLMRALVAQSGDEEEYEQLPDYQRDLFWNFKLPIFGDRWISLPKPFELGMPSSIIDRAISKNRGYDDAYDGVVGSTWKALVPFDDASVLGSVKPLAEAFMNHDLFRDRDIVPFYEKDKILELREGTKYASRIGQLVSDAFGFVNIESDPRKIDHVIKGYTTYFGDWALSIGDIGKKDSRYEFNIRKSGFAKDRPISNSRSVAKAFKLAKGIGADTSPQIKALRTYIKMYYNLDSDQVEAKRKLAKEIYKYADEVNVYLKQLKKVKLEKDRLKKLELEKLNN